MPIDRKLWQDGIGDDYVPAWPCPRCGASSLQVVKDSYQTKVDAETASNWDDDHFDTAQYTGRFSCILQCQRSGCRETCSACGDYSMAGGESDHGYIEFSWGKPKCVWPAPSMIKIPRKCPLDIAGEVKSAFALYWCDLNSCLNRIRNAIELLLDDLGVSKTSTKNGKRTRLSLHSRIEKLKAKKPKLADICNQMMAVKHLGNAGSHPGVRVEHKDVFDGFDILERVLNYRYGNPDSELAKIVKEINKRKGPRAGRVDDD